MSRRPSSPIPLPARNTNVNVRLRNLDWVPGGQLVNRGIGKSLDEVDSMFALYFVALTLPAFGNLLVFADLKYQRHSPSLSL